uniref:ATP synthase subunit 6 n=1 Tax=Ayyaria chaetophora TaxID=1291247 RepID=UPI0030E3739E
MLLLSLFISFDPKSSMTLFFNEMNWIIMLLTMVFMFETKWNKINRNNMIFIDMIKTVSKQFEISMKNKKDGNKLIFTSIFLSILMMNTLGLIPFSFTPSSHITINLFISLPMWMGFYMYGWKKHQKEMFSHLVPSGTPTILISFMVMIELISSLIRPLTLSIRLMANMVSGHLLLTLLGNSMNLKPLLIVSLMLIVQTTLYILETSVCFIQAYVFSMLLTLYSSESEY